MSDSSPSGAEGIEMAAAGAWNESRAVPQVDDRVTLPAVPDGTVIVAAGRVAERVNAGIAQPRKRVQGSSRIVSMLARNASRWRGYADSMTETSTMMCFLL